MSAEQQRKRRRVASRGSSRDRMRAKRALPPAFNPAAPGQHGGQYKPLSDSDVDRIYHAALEVLAEIGMDEIPPVLLAQLLKCGAERQSNGRVTFPVAMVEDIIDKACKSFVLHGRDTKHDLQVGGDQVYFGTGGAAVQTKDLETGQYRPSTLQDLHDFTRLADALENISWFTRCCVATDVADIFALDLNTAFALAKNTAKPVGTSFTLASSVDPIVQMFDIALGGEGKFAERPFCKAHISPVISPLRYGDDAVEVALACMRHRMPINAIVGAQSGATAPASMAGMLTQTLAETLASLIMVNVFEPGYPMIFSNWPLVIDLRTGSFSGGGGEEALLNAAAAQLSNFLGMPSGVAACMSDAKAIDAQMGMEKGITALATGLAGSNMIYESAGMAASLLGVSFEAFVADNEMLSHVQRVLRGIEVNDESIGIDAIRSVVSGEGHFLGTSQTMLAMERDYYYPLLGDRQDPTSWQQQGAVEHADSARKRARQLLDDHKVNYLAGAAESRIRDSFDILL